MLLIQLNLRRHYHILEYFAGLYNDNILPVNVNVVGGYIVRLDLQEKILGRIKDC
jgi:hypothetical protein